MNPIHFFDIFLFYDILYLHGENDMRKELKKLWIAFVDAIIVVIMAVNGEFVFLKNLFEVFSD